MDDVLLSLDNVTTYYAQMRILEGISLKVGAGRAGVPARRQRVGQVDHAEDDPRDRASALGPRAAGGRGRHRLAGPAADRQRPGDRPREPPAVRSDDRPREPRARRGASNRLARRGLRTRAHPVPAPARAPRPDGGHAVGRRAADGRDGPSADVKAAHAADGRAVDGSLARARAAELPRSSRRFTSPASQC